MTSVPTLCYILKSCDSCYLSYFYGRMRWVSTMISSLLALLLPMVEKSDGQSEFNLTDVSSLIQAKFEHFSGQTGKHFIVETITSGMATFDYDGDGWTDVYFLTGAPLQGDKNNEQQPNRLFRNLGNFQFIDVTQATGAGDLGFALGVTAGDYDNDGDQDLFISNFGPNIMLQNNGDGTFSRHEFPNSKPAPRVGAGVSLLDIDHDGNLDVFFANYIEFSFEKSTKQTVFGAQRVSSPKDYDPDSNTLLSNTGDGTFEDISAASGIASFAGPGMGIVAFDYDADGDTDVFVCNDSAANFLFQNDGDRKFSEVALLTGVAYDVTGSQQATMGVDVGDFDGDGFLDLVTTNYDAEIPTLYKNSGLGFFDDIGPAVGFGAASRNLKWGVAFADLDNDSWPDLIMATGHLMKDASKLNDSVTFAARNVYLRNIQGKKFSDFSTNVGTAADSIKASRAIALDDLDNDGNVDAVILNSDTAPQWIRNETNNSNHWCELCLIGVKANRDAVGARVIVQCNNRKLVQDIVSGRGYQSHFGSRLHFGVGQSKSIDVEVHWPGGDVQSFRSLPVQQLLLLREGFDSAIRLR